uniref:39S ribosomal protein L35, mitochondrial n=1 Tax=Rodentolepis nana TaxID=102285 RepID=A0A0R3T9R8_RODNA
LVCFNFLIFPLYRTTPVIAQPIRGVQRQEAKRYYVEDGTADPPVQVVIDRFKRLRWGAYIHPRAGRRKHLYRKRPHVVAKMDEHILTSRAMSFALDNMLNKDWRKPKYYPEDIYEPYHCRTGVPWDYASYKRRFYP